jgi:FKBP-type peptidyl-prolyl cis-trans isomerase
MIRYKALVYSSRVCFSLASAVGAALAATAMLSGCNPPQSGGIETVPDMTSGTTANRVKLSAGTSYIDLRVGSGDEATTGKTVLVKYVIRLDGGVVWDSTDASGSPKRITLGVGALIKGWDDGIIGMRVGGLRTLIMPPDRARTPDGKFPGYTPPCQPVTSVVELLQVF